MDESEGGGSSESMAESIIDGLFVGCSLWPPTLMPLSRQNRDFGVGRPLFARLSPMLVVQHTNQALEWRGGGIDTPYHAILQASQRLFQADNSHARAGQRCPLANKSHWMRSIACSDAVVAA